MVERETQETSFVLLPGAGGMAWYWHRVSLLLTFGIVVDLMVLGYFKYTDFLISTANTLLQTNFILQHIVLPLGISFFTFQKIAYLVDSSRGEVADHDLLEYCFFVMFFPQLLAGPITHHSEIFSQLKGPWAFAVKPSNFMLGVTIFVIGLFKKVVLADHFAPLVSPAYEAAAAGQPLDFFLAWQGAIAFKFQLYFDFSGYSEMALGSARLFGIQLPLNFNSPYRALNVVDFWRRWHMTLSRFLRDYVYIPLGGNRHGLVRRYANLMIVMLVGGLWHGAGWTYVIWGGLHGFYLLINHAWRGMAAHWRLPLVGHFAGRLLAWALTFSAVTLAWVFFRAPTVRAALGMVGSMLDIDPTHSRALRPSLMQDPVTLLGILTLLAPIAFLMPNSQTILRDFEPAYNWQAYAQRPYRLVRGLVWRPSVGWAVFIGTCFAVSVMNFSNVGEFIYFNF